MCEIEFDNGQRPDVRSTANSTEGSKIEKIREHNHFNGKYRGASCQSCNTLEGKASKIIPVFFHNGSRYDFHFIITELMKQETKL